MAGFIEDFDYRDVEVKKLAQAIGYGHAQYVEDWNTAVACTQIMGTEPGHECLERVLEACMMRVNAYAQVSGEKPW